jgi:hypothetical protein
MSIISTSVDRFIALLDRWVRVRERSMDLAERSYEDHLKRQQRYGVLPAAGEAGGQQQSPPSEVEEKDDPNAGTSTAAETPEADSVERALEDYTVEELREELVWLGGKASPKASKPTLIKRIKQARADSEAEEKTGTPAEPTDTTAESVAPVPANAVTPPPPAKGPTDEKALEIDCRRKLTGYFKAGNDPNVLIKSITGNTKLGAVKELEEADRIAAYNKIISAIDNTGASS